MGRAGGHNKQSGGAPELVAVAVGADKSSQHALKWAADHVISRGQIFVLLHVRPRVTTVPTPTGSQLPISEVEDDVAAAFLQQIDNQTKELLLPFQCFCSRRGLQCKEIILDDTDIPKAIVDFVRNEFVDKLVLGASSRNLLSRTFKLDMPTSVSKSAPDFCSVYVISRGKISSTRPALQQNKHPIRQSHQFGTTANQFQSVKSEPVAGHHMELTGRSTVAHGASTGPVGEFRLSGVHNDGMSGMNSKVDQAETYPNCSYQSTVSCPSPSRPIIDRPGNYYPRDYLESAQQSCLPQVQIENGYPNEQVRGLELNRDGTAMWSGGSNSSSFELSSAVPQGHGRTSWSYKSMENVESEMERLKLELMKTMDMYNNACLEVFNVKQQIEVLSCIRHPNMVLLIGACPEFGCLVYEYMANGSLEDRLFCKSNTCPLPWQLRFRIAAEIATGLLFLHQMKPKPLVHRDLKPGNILLDHNFVSKIADVGLARLVPPSVADAVTQYRMTTAAGTFCYIDPEYQQTGMLGIKSDIYALGIILLQLVTAVQPMGLAHNVERALEEGMFRRLLDPNVPDWPMEETLTLTRLALKCAELRKKDRPDLATVILPELNRLREVAERTPISPRVWPRYSSGQSLQVGLPPTGSSSYLGVVKGISSMNIGYSSDSSTRGKHLLNLDMTSNGRP